MFFNHRADDRHQTQMDTDKIRRPKSEARKKSEGRRPKTFFEQQSEDTKELPWLKAKGGKAGKRKTRNGLLDFWIHGLMDPGEGTAGDGKAAPLVRKEVQIDLAAWIRAKAPSPLSLCRRTT